MPAKLRHPPWPHFLSGNTTIPPLSLPTGVLCACLLRARHVCLSQDHAIEKPGILAFKQRQYLVKKLQKAALFDHTGCPSELGTSLLCQPKGVAPRLHTDKPPTGPDGAQAPAPGWGATAMCLFHPSASYHSWKPEMMVVRGTLPPVLLANSYLSLETSPKHLCSGRPFSDSPRGQPTLLEHLPPALGFCNCCHSPISLSAASSVSSVKEGPQLQSGGRAFWGC